MKIPFLGLILFLFVTNVRAQSSEFVYESATLKIEKVSANTYRHISYLQTEQYGKVACNGMIVVDGPEAYVFDTPSEDSVSAELIHVIKGRLEASVKGVVINHYHNDCLGGLDVFHEKNIPSYANQLTIKLAIDNGMKIPKTGFNDSLLLKTNNLTIINRYLGKGHSSDNIVSYVREEEVLFGGCLVKCLYTGKGYLGDASVEDWPTTIRAIKTTYPNLITIIPGHGPVGGQKLLDYTIELFE